MSVHKEVNTLIF